MLGLVFPVFGLTMFLAACDSATGPPEEPRVEAVLKVPFSLSAGQTAVLKKDQLQVTFMGVSEDTRCPIDTVCIQAGNATISIRAQQEGKDARTLSLTLTDDPHAVVYEGFSIDAQELEPPRKTDGSISPGDYRVRLLVDRP